MSRKLSAVDLAVLRKEKIALPIGTRFNYHGQVMEVSTHTDAEDGTHVDQSIPVAVPQTEKEEAPEATSASKSAAEWKEEEPTDNASQADDVELSKEACACEDSEESEQLAITSSEVSSIGSPEELSSDNAFLQNLATQEKAAARKKHNPEENIASEYEGLQKLIDSM